MAMRPFCGYNMGDYFRHWVELGLGRPGFPKIFHVNWFRQGASGKFLWPGFGENLRVLRWIHGRVSGKAQGRETPVGIMPADGELDTSGLDLNAEAMRELFAIDRDAWLEEARDREAFLESFGARVPEALLRQNRDLVARMQA
ncbi:hypothetical protein BE04_43860 [Sorangium cellulosum]|nr:hypothetical protein BE04_43860 [Sorangium cellulosum]